VRLALARCILAAVARWGVRGVSLTVRAYDDVPSVVLVAERIDGDAREWRAIGDGTVRDAAAWLGWTVRKGGGTESRPRGTTMLEFITGILLPLFIIWRLWNLLSSNP